MYFFFNSARVVWFSLHGGGAAEVCGGFDPLLHGIFLRGSFAFFFLMTLCVFNKSAADLSFGTRMCVDAAAGDGTSRGVFFGRSEGVGGL